MCLAVPARVVELNGDTAIVDLDGIRKETSTILLDEVTVGDYVLIHVGYALERIDPLEAAKTLALFAELRAQDAEA
ncbi:MAG: HypC/HybG/HupF family hydrogenase formation chaperone [Zetaproteobacteria bacterium CG12_big_fil_rev_8_21_14_0_65_55_1124]|nr:MAG: hydrogenase assembly protein HupF [Zetaproteobacteria bacterium CG1_02_55_237]PIS20217.1 MAG: HypC/HybG/HupF family hydrogenase formation chaperone [Zetaproteobacteria bacterium CG08_land_8_20_14_0_20_55_17]PIW43374.1 MAG: HypC/HybG/HupF family hydrogenase formation chaperone [Zetaproteobacteria bacterium CG12_big_fil_rev_8_21_14_0_65_55_1124]PIY53080.1 MAG: HypC/HybG/HupF family hydrogenase formation chaperone [Zetaproteobacteria bacterium CG_4_10_14_0_8_um_filter_55_43]PIZ39990.1 MAG: